MGYIRIVLRRGNLIFSLGSQWLYLKKNMQYLHLESRKGICNLQFQAYRFGVCEYITYIKKSCPTLCDRMNCSSPGSSVHGILQARILE